MRTIQPRFCAPGFAFILMPLAGLAQSNLVIYIDALASGWANYSYWSTANLTNTNSVHSGTNSIAVTSTTYASLSFWINGGPTGRQRLWVGSSPHGSSYPLGILAANTWQQYTVPRSIFGNAATKVERIKTDGNSWLAPR